MRLNIQKIRNFLMLFYLLFVKFISPKAKEVCENCKFSLFQLELI